MQIKYLQADIVKNVEGISTTQQQQNSPIKKTMGTATQAFLTQEYIDSPIGIRTVTYYQSPLERDKNHKESSPDTNQGG